MIPEPYDHESESKYIDRCFVDDDIINRYPNSQHRYEMICIKWRVTKDIEMKRMETEYKR